MQFLAPLTKSLSKPTSGSTATLARSRTVLVTLVTAVTLALLASGYQLLGHGKSVTLSLDGSTRQVDANGDTVAEVLDDQGIEVGKHDVVAPSLDTPVDDGARIAVRYGRPLKVNFDGKKTKHWVTATDVVSALDQIGMRIGGANLSTSRGAEISRNGMSLTIATPKRLTFLVAGGRPVHKQVAALTVAQALKMRGVKVDKDDVVSPGLGKVLRDGDRIQVTKVRVVKRAVNDESVPFTTETTEDPSMYEGDDKVVREGRNGSRDVTYRLRLENGKVVASKVLHVENYVAPVAELLKVGTKQQPVASYSTGSTVWDQIAQCESGGNWAANTGNGYYGGLQFNLSTWQSYGGTGLPSENSREQQIAIAERVRDASGGYGAWPVCGSGF